MFKRLLAAAVFAVAWVAVKVFGVLDERNLRHASQ